MPKAPESYRAALRLAGGDNLYGEPRFKLVWGTEPIRRSGSPDQLLGEAFDCWCLIQWRPPEDFGIPETWAPDMGPFPARGLYIILQAFRYSGVRSALDSPTLNPEALRMAVRFALESEEMTLATRERILKEHLSLEDRRRLDLIEDKIRDARPIGDVVIGAGKHSGTSVIGKKLDQIERSVRMRRLARLQTPKLGMTVQQDRGHVMSVPTEGGSNA